MSKLHLQSKAASSSKKNKIQLASTFITAEMSTKIEEADYAYYVVNEGVRPPPDALYYVPSEDDIILNKDDKSWQRLIFPEDGDYRDYEEELYEKFEDYVDSRDIIIPNHVGKSLKLRFIQANHYKVEKAVEDLLTHLEWRRTNLPICLTTDQKRFLDEGLFYIHGRDKNFRPLNIFDPRVIIGKKADRDEVIMIVHFVLQFIIDNMFIPGKIENWVSIMDLSNLSINELPKQWLNSFIKSCQSNYKCRGVKSFILNASWGIRLVWKLVSPFVDAKVKQKMVFYDGPHCEEFINMFHPSQLEEKFGGTAPDLEVFWPPKEISKEYGVDPSKIQKKTRRYDDSADADVNDDESISNMEQAANGILNDSLVFNHKFRNLNEDTPVDVEEVKIGVVSEKMKKLQLRVKNKSKNKEDDEMSSLKNDSIKVRFFNTIF